MGARSLEMNTDVFNQIGRAVHETFSSIFSIELKTFKIEKGVSSSPPKNISGHVLLRDPDFRGSLSVGFPPEMALKVFSLFYGVSLENIDERVLEGVGEVTNMIYGSLKKNLNQDGFEFEMFIPFVLFGHQSPATIDDQNDSATIHFTSDLGDFWVELSLRK